MEPRSKSIVTAITALAILLAGAVALFALQLLIVGVPLTVVTEIPEGTQELPMMNIEYAPYFPGVVPLVAMILFIGGLLTQKLWVGWLGWAMLIIFSLLFLFSSGAALLPAVGVLLVLLTIISYARRQPDGSPVEKGQ
jgi:hypothetical protein